MRKIKLNRTVYTEEQFLFWINKWGLSHKQLNEAIIETGSLDAYELRDFLVRKGTLVSVFGLLYCSNESMRIFFKLTKKNISTEYVSESKFVAIPKIPFIEICYN